MKRTGWGGALMVMTAVVTACAAGETPAPPAEGETPHSPLALTSPAFAAGEAIPAVYSCRGDDISPPLDWSEPPAGTASLALIMDDPDAPAGTWVHWLLYDIPAEARSLADSVPAQESLADGSRHGRNSWGRNDYGGPCPPGGTHRYFFKLYALDKKLELAPGATKDELLQAMTGHILAEAELIGRFSR